MRWGTGSQASHSYALHLWNYLNQGGRGVVRGRNKLVQNLCHQHCPRTYRDMIQGPEGLVTGESGPGIK